jgi:hypothetical protein
MPTSHPDVEHVFEVITENDELRALLHVKGVHNVPEVPANIERPDLLPTKLCTTCWV